MKVALDIDGTISEHPGFFALLSSALRAAGHGIVVLTYRDPSCADATRTLLAEWGIEFDELVFAPTLAAKAEICGSLGIDVFFDDQDECLQSVPQNILVCKVRNGGNFRFANRRWLSTAELTEFIR